MSSTKSESDTSDMSTKRPFRIRTITTFVTLHPDDFKEDNDDVFTGLATKINKCNDILRKLETSLTNIGYEVQTVRIATNPFGEWLTISGDYDDNGPLTQKKLKVDESGAIDKTTTRVKKRLTKLEELLDAKDINFCSLGPSVIPNDTLSICPIIVESSGKFSCSANINAGDIESARAAATCMQIISKLGDDNDAKNAGQTTDTNHIKGGLGNFRFCAASCIKSVPFFPGARAPSDANHSFSFAIGLENGGFAHDLLEEAANIGNIKNVFHKKMRDELLPIQEVCTSFVNDNEKTNVQYLGIDTSLNPSLDEGGSVAEAIESLEEVRDSFGGTGTLAAAAAITTSLQSIPGITTTGYSGLMLPVLEDQRLADLGRNSCAPEGQSKDGLTVQKLLCISSVCGVGIDTVPIPGNVSEDDLSSLILDVAALASRWNKPLSCRVFPVPGGKAGEETTFDSPYMCNSCIFDL